MMLVKDDLFIEVIGQERNCEHVNERPAGTGRRTSGVHLFAFGLFTLHRCWLYVLLLHVAKVVGSTSVPCHRELSFWANARLGCGWSAVVFKPGTDTILGEVT